MLFGDDVLDVETGSRGRGIREVTVLAAAAGTFTSELAHGTLQPALDRLSRLRALAWSIAMKSIA
jgi:hypothetical protein